MQDYLKFAICAQLLMVAVLFWVKIYYNEASFDRNR